MIFGIKSLTPMWQRLLITLLLSNGFSVLLFFIRVYGTDTSRYSFMLWNLFLAWIPLFLAVILVKRLRYARWLSPINLSVSLLWLLFLPNSFYVLSDLVHLQTTGEINILFDAVLFFSFIMNGFIAGLWSLYCIHQELKRRLTPVAAATIINGALLLSGFAIYLGRTMRWNAWDVFVHPFGILFDVSEGLINPLSHPQVIVTTGTFFLLTCALYWTIYYFIQVLQPPLTTRKKRR